MPELLFELGAEELPPDSLITLSNQIFNNICKQLNEQSISFNKTNTTIHATPRRIVISLKDLPVEQPLKTLEIKGPDKSKSFDTNGTPTQAAIGFAKKHKLEPKDLIIKKINDIEYVFALTQAGGSKTKEILGNILPESIRQTTGKKFMRWGSYNETFSRPIRWIIALFDNEIIKLNFASIESSNYTYGNKFLRNNKLYISSYKDYKETLLNNFVILNTSERINKITNDLENEAKKINGIALINKELVEEVANITEYPSPIVCSFNKEFLSLPSCIIETVLKKHQKNFITKDSKNNLLPNFIAFTNGADVINKEKQDFIKKQIQRGNEKVVKARLSDAQFFFKEDLKRTFQYNERIKDLSKITFQKGLGSLENKVSRLTEISKYIYDKLKETTPINEPLEDILTTTRLCKLDLSTHMVFEFTELQGEIGAVYAKINGFNENISQGIIEHYYPRFINDKYPQTFCGLICGLADKIDNLVCLFLIGKIPSGSADPFALRRQAQAIIEHTLNKNLKLNISDLINHTKEKIQTTALKNNSGIDIEKKINEFLTQRFISTMEILGFESDLILSVTSITNPLEDLVKAKDKILALKESFSSGKNEKLQPFLVAAKRLVRIVEETTNGHLIKNDLQTEHEKLLFEKLEDLENKANKEQYKTTLEYLNALTSLTQSINLFFDNVLVNDPNPKIKQTRQALLKKGKLLFERICDFNQIQERI